VETKRLKRIKPQPVPRRHLFRCRRHNRPERAQNTENELDALLAQWRRTMRFRRPVLSKRVANLLLLVLAVILFSWFASALSMPVPWRLLAVVAILLPVTFLLMRLTVSDRLFLMSLQLSGCDDVRAIPALVRALCLPDGWARVAAARALTRLLPRLRPCDSGLLDAAARSRLRQQLRRYRAMRTPELAFAILLALEEVGDARDIPTLTTLIRRCGRSSVEQRLRQAAQSCLARLAARKEQVQEEIVSSGEIAL
jgi:hypothetical protein